MGRRPFGKSQLNRFVAFAFDPGQCYPARRIAFNRSPGAIDMPKVISHGYCVEEFDRTQFGAAATQDTTRMIDRQKELDIHYTGVAYDKRYPVVWCGLTSFVGDLLWTFDPKTKRFKSKGFRPLREPEEIKIHRGLQVGPDGLVYFGTASLLDIRRRHEAPGGRLFRYHPAKDEYEFLGRPVEHDYIQNIAVDHERGIIYGATYPLGWFFGWDIEKRRTLFKAFIADLPHQVCVDDQGNCWGSYRLSYETPGDVRLIRYSPANGRLTWTDIAMPGDFPDRSALIDTFVNGGDGFLYIGADTGVLFRLDPTKGKVEMVARPAASRQFGALSPPVRGKIHGIAGNDKSAEVFSYDLATGKIVTYGPAYDAKRKTYLHRPHELAMGPDRCLYCPETDNFERQCYFWECRLSR